MYGGVGGGGCAVGSPSTSAATLRGHSAPDGQRASRWALQHGSAAGGGEGICNSPIVAAPTESPAPLTVDAGALLLLD